ncbi:P-loop containing nucleoside triphosphate hydrolase protein [Aspergillus novoparasiticus]|uniref:P-loop containing nucleoside triphosphate hydrolase protein n=1 Tax=Aspergillus novoparasiticus TaxID=986946 RepID=A0A5N6E7U1_9EURO|nr:P-loop containing nucleoside triphosphate hydrolase protein [Aspergillus novoparasiticus]
MIRVIPDPDRSGEEQKSIKAFRETITSFDELPRVMAKATELMGIDKANDREASNDNYRRAFARDVLSVEIEGPNRPQLTVVDLPGIVQSQTKDTTQADVDMTVEITESYIYQPRTICLAVISATNDYANQPILNKVRQFDPKGERTLGIITKPDRLPPGSDTENQFFRLAQNEDVYFELGWHILKNRSFEETEFSIQERNSSESNFLRKSIFGSLPPTHIGISSLVNRLSRLLFSHVQQALPRLQEELDEALENNRREISVLGEPRTSPEECRMYLTQLGLNFYEICKAAVNGHYEGPYFISEGKESHIQRLALTRRLRAAIQLMNQEFAEEVRVNGHKYHIHGINENSANTKQMDPEPLNEESAEDDDETISTTVAANQKRRPFSNIKRPKKLARRKAITWVNDVVIRARGRELLGNFNPLVIAELFWEQSSKWHLFAKAHIDEVSGTCQRFLESVLKDKAPLDIFHRLWPTILEKIKTRHRNALEELAKVLKDTRSYVINYNHYYTDTIKKRQSERRRNHMSECIEEATEYKKLPGCKSDHTFPDIDISHALGLFSDRIDPNMDNHSSEEVLDCLFAIYKVYQKLFIANVTIQVIERHIVQDLELIFCPLTVAKLSDTDAVALASEPSAIERQREFLIGRVAKLEQGREILGEVMSSN